MGLKLVYSRSRFRRSKESSEHDETPTASLPLPPVVCVHLELGACPCFTCTCTLGFEITNLSFCRKKGWAWVAGHPHTVEKEEDQCGCQERVKEELHTKGPLFVYLVLVRVGPDFFFNLTVLVNAMTTYSPSPLWK